MQNKKLNQLRDKKISTREFAFLVLSGFFIASLLLTNIIAGKFFQLKLPFFDDSFTVSCGIIAYPVTFVVTDVISEIFGESRANLLVKIGFLVSVFSFLILLIANSLPTSESSPVNNQSFQEVFGFTPVIIFSSMLAYLVAQFVDVKIFELVRKLTNGKYLWLRNNVSTITSQLIDTSLVVLVVFVVYPYFASRKVEDFDFVVSVIFAQYIFKVIVAFLDTPIVYLSVNYLKKIC